MLIVRFMMELDASEVSYPTIKYNNAIDQTTI
jgi:hypothetical protein